MKRRSFLIASGIGATAIAISGMAFNSTALFSRGVTLILKTHLPYLQIPDIVIEEFITDLEKHINRYTFANEQKTRYHVAKYSASSGKRFSKTTEFIVTKFLLSTDFFLNKMDESRPLTYIGFHGSLGRPCRNPFSHIYYPNV